MHINCKFASSIIIDSIDPIPYINTYYSIGEKYHFMNKSIISDKFDGILNNLALNFGSILMEYIEQCQPKYYKLSIFNINIQVDNDFETNEATEEENRIYDRLIEYEVIFIIFQKIKLPTFYDDQCYDDINHYINQTWFDDQGKICICVKEFQYILRVSEELHALIIFKINAYILIFFIDK
ncbi:hypothetical protein HZS_4345, partial [Henneguya salminicola]